MDGKSEDENTEAPRIIFICPKCRIVYEHGGACIRCGSPVVDKTQSEVEEESPPLPVREVETGELSLSSEVVIEEEAPKAAPAQEVTRQIPTPQKPFSLHRSLNRLPKSGIRDAGLPRRKGKKLFRLSREVASVLILLGTGGYLCWSLYSNFVAKRPEASTMVSKGAGTAVLSHSPAPVDPPASSPDSQENMRKHGTESPPISKEEATAPVPKTASPALPSSSTPDVPEAENIRNLLKNIQQGNLRKDIELFMSCYSSTFKGREGKRKETLENWEHFNYFSLSYDLKNCSITGNAASARVEWRIKYSPKGDGQPQESQTVLDVKLKREGDGWKITEVKPVG
jgi:hypothetical protein